MLRLPPLATARRWGRIDCRRCVRRGRIFPGRLRHAPLAESGLAAAQAVFIWLASLTILAMAAFLLKSTDNLSRGTVIILLQSEAPD